MDVAPEHKSENRSPLIFFPLVFALSVPLWLISGFTPLQLAPGLPLSSLMVFCPMIAAAILVYRRNGIAGLAGLLKRSFDYGRMRAKVWYAPAILLAPIIAVLSYGAMRLLEFPLPEPQFPGPSVPFMFLLAIIAALGEELGWLGYVIDPMQERWDALWAGIILGSVWAAWHVVTLVQAERSPSWIAWQCFTILATRVLLVWLYNNTGKSVFAGILYHAMVNISWQLFPNSGSHYDPRITGVITALAAVTVTVIWGPRTLARKSNA